MTDSAELKRKDKELPSWVQVSVGLILGLFILFCVFASLSLLVTPHRQRSILLIIVGFALLHGCLWVLEMCFRLLTERKYRGGLMAPRILRVLSLSFSDSSSGGLLYRLLPGDGARGDISSNVFL